jgi:hypothetical protein
LRILILQLRRGDICNKIGHRDLASRIHVRSAPEADIRNRRDFASSFWPSSLASSSARLRCFWLLQRSMQATQKPANG